MTGAQLLVEALEGRGVEYVFTLCGNGLNAFYYAALGSKINFVDVRNEQAASYMADVWGRLTRQVGVVAVSSGPGHINALSGVANAYWDGSPMLLISGHSGRAANHQDCFQELDQVSIIAPMCKYARFVDEAALIPHCIHEAFVAATTGRPGPVHLTIPADVLAAEVPGTDIRSRTDQPRAVSPRGSGDSALVDEAVHLLSNAERPFIVAGSGVFYADGSDALRTFAARTQIPVTTPMWDRGCIEEEYEEYVGVAGVNPASEEFRNADTVLSLGVRFDHRFWSRWGPAYPEHAKLIRVNVDPSEIQRNITPDIGIVGDPASVLRQLNKAAEGATWSHKLWRDTLCAKFRTSLDAYAAQAQTDDMPADPARVCLEIGECLTPETMLFADAGAMGQWTYRTLYTRHPGHWMTCGLSGVVGWGLPGAIAAKLAYPDRPLILLSGDGAFTFTPAEINSARKSCTHFVIVLADNESWGIVRCGMPDDRRIACDLGPLAFDQVCDAFGGHGIRITHPSQIAPAIQEGLKQENVTLIHVPTRCEMP